MLNVKNAIGFQFVQKMKTSKPKINNHKREIIQQLQILIDEADDLEFSLKILKKNIKQMIELRFKIFNKNQDVFS